jgi:uncharacterized protein YijF (DUF1287 family)
MLALPVLLIAFTIAVGRWTNGGMPNEFATTTPGATRALNGLPAVATPVSLRLPATMAVAVAVPEQTRVPVNASPIDEITAAAAVPAPVPLAAPEAQALLPLTSPLEAVDVARAAPQTAVTAHPHESIGPAPADPTPKSAVDPAPVAIAMLSPDRSIITKDFPPPDALSVGPSQCRLEPATPPAITWTPGNTESFGLALATAARHQLKEFVIYNDRYTRLKYPMGDVHPMYGVCTDVIIRAYRALGLDLQELVQKTKAGSGDPNIDHRRVETLRKFFSRFGESLPISTFAEDYKAGDIVTYWRPQNRHSRTHIAIVSDVIGPSGRPLIIHNRGWGPQQEDGLFVDEITGHYRFSGLKGPTEAEGKAPLKSVPVGKPAATGRAEETKPQRPILRTGLSSSAASH